MLEGMELYSIYLHIPFCIHRCCYCDFNTYAGRQAEIPDYCDALCMEIREVSQAAGGVIPVHSIYLGGGTPSLLPLAQHQQILDTIKSHFDLLPDAEISLEVNPGTISKEYLGGLHKLGYNRISIGMQSANPEHLRLLERQHSPVDVIQAVAWARLAGFDQINLDLIFGLPGQTATQWQESLDFAVELRTEHLSLYGLTIEPETPIFRWINQGLVAMPDTDLAADMYEWAIDRLPEAGFIQYEISNWAKAGDDGILLACRHNMQYWYNRPYFGFGAGAHGYFSHMPGIDMGALYQIDRDHVSQGIRTENVPGIREYIEAVTRGVAQPFPYSPANKLTTPVDSFTEMQETMMVGLRLTQTGVSAVDFETRFGIKMVAVFDQEIEKSMSRGLLEWAGESGSHLRLTRRGRLLGNRVFMDFVGKKKKDQPDRHSIFTQRGEAK